ncbi:hypothetical protein KR074_009905 [Drosophila pseudoananassae]|nr:hypothetical protein KR074_009905 [Drosophila pseudoananassae]
MVSYQQQCLLWLVFQLVATLGQQLQGAPRPRGRIRIADMPLPAPGGALNWPSLTLSGSPISSTVHTHIPLLREESSQKPAMPSQEAVVYGNWKPEHPEKPDSMETETDTKSDQQPRERVYGRLEAMLMGMPADDIDVKPSSSSEEQTAPIAPGSFQNGAHLRPTSSSFERPPEKHGRKKITSQQPPHLFEVTRVNNTDPLLKAMVKKINEPMETTTTIVSNNPVPTADDSWMPLPYPYPYDTTVATTPATSSMIPGFMQSSGVHLPAPTQATRSTSELLNWPTDFIDSASNTVSPNRVEGNYMSNIDRRDESIADPVDEYKYYEESLNSAQMHSELSVPETMPLNITRVGIPYEDRNASEEPTICVPLTVSETSHSSDSALPLMVEVERVYCFPLPKVEVRTGHVRPQVEQVTRSNPRDYSGMEFQPTEAPIPSNATAGATRRSHGVWFIVVVSMSWWPKLRI